MSSAEDPDFSVLSETRRHLVASELTDARDVLFHEGLKKAVEQGLYLAGSHKLGRLILEKLGTPPIDDPRLETELAGLALAGPGGLAPGWDKTGRTLQAWQTLGARHYTAGAVTFFGQSGNFMPRLYTFDRRIGDHGTSRSLNSFGFWGPKADKVIYNLERQKAAAEVNIPTIVQVTLNKEFYLPENLHLVPDLVRMTIAKVIKVADGISLGLSSFNTPGMRNAQDNLDFLLRVVEAARLETDKADKHLPLIYKGDGDGGEARLEKYTKLTDYIDVIELINSTALKHIKAKYGTENLDGGLAGADGEFQALMLESVRFMYEAVGHKIGIQATGGINSGHMAYRAHAAGASSWGVNSAVRERGLYVIRKNERELLEIIDHLWPRLSSLAELIGSETDRGPKNQFSKA